MRDKTDPEYRGAAGGFANPDAIDWKARAEAAEAEVEELRGAAMCPVCTGNPISSKPCICGGSGRAQDAYLNLNRLHFDTEAEVEGLTASRDHYRVGMNRALASLAAVRELVENFHRMYGKQDLLRLQQRDMELILATIDGDGEQ